MSLLVFLMLVGCPSRDVECSEEKPCPFGETCREDVCVSQSCATSVQCGIEQYCKDSECVGGCEVDEDCMFGDLCDTEAKACTPAECTNTSLDCDFGEFCSPDGSCYDAGGFYCKPCRDDGDCGGGENMCLSGDCGVWCNDDHDCPAGFDCYPVYDFNGNVVSNQCYTDCASFNEAR